MEGVLGVCNSVNRESYESELATEEHTTATARVFRSLGSRVSRAKAT